MTELVLRQGRSFIDWAQLHGPRNSFRLMMLALLAAVVLAMPELRPAALTAVSDAYLEVTVFVALTLAIIYGLERGLGVDVGRVMANARWLQVPIAAALGATPGCGGAIIVVTQFVRGHASFGALVAVLIATMGDAVFLLLARAPEIGVAMMGMGFAVGSMAGWVVDYIHGKAFMAVRNDGPGFGERRQDQAPAGGHVLDFGGLARSTWVALAIPGVVLGLAGAFQLDTDGWFQAVLGATAGDQPTFWFGVLGGLVCLAMWAAAPAPNAHADPFAANRPSLVRKITGDTNFVTGWVVFGFFSYEVAVHFAGAGVEVWFQTHAMWMPLLAILAGFIPGCGPQIVVTTLYLAQAIPLSAQIGNAIANDGDALFPALALAPRAAALATVYSAVPAVLVAYGYMALFE